MAKSSGSIWVSLGLTTQNFSKGVSRARKDLSGFQKFTGGLKNMFNPFTIGVGAIASVGAAIGDAIGIINDFDKANSGLAAVLGKNKSEIKGLTQQAKDLGSTTAFTASQVGELQTELAKLGFVEGEIKNMAASTLDAAAALGSELGEQAALTGATLNSFGLESKDAARVNDVLAKSASTSALDFSKLSAALPIVGATAKASGFDLERTTAVLGTLSNAGLDASSSATAFRNILIKLSQKGLTFEEAMEKIRNSSDKTKTSFELFGKTSATAGVILSENQVALKDLETGLKDASGAAKEMADTMLDNLSGDMTKAGSAWEGFVLSIEDGQGVISKAMRSVTQEWTEFLGMVTRVNDEGWAGFKANWTEATGVYADLAQKTGVEASKLDLAFAKNQAATQDLTKRFAEGKIDAEQYNAAINKLADGWTMLSNSMQKVNDASDMSQMRESIKAASKELFKAFRAGDISLDEYKASLNELESTFRTKVKSGFKVAKEAAAGLGGEIEGAGDDAEEATEKVKKLAEIDVKGFGLGSRTGRAVDGIKTMVSGIEKELANNPPKLQIPVLPELEVPEETTEKINGNMIAIGEGASEALGQGLEQSAEGALVGIGEAIGEGNITGIGDALVQSFSGLLQSFGTQMIALGVGMKALQDSLSLGPFGSALAIAGGVALIAVAQAIKSSLADAPSAAFADGGIVSGPVNALVGEYSGARTNPEVIAPLDKLRGMIGGMEGGMGGEVKFRIEGKELVGILSRYNKVNKFST